MKTRLEKSSMKPSKLVPFRLEEVSVEVGRAEVMSMPASSSCARSRLSSSSPTPSSGA
ncbi:MAG: hypothetical protein ACI8T1_002498 [Verrucomicrobiales bacterium]|jgi:hypothetical protein